MMASVWAVSVDRISLADWPWFWAAVWESQSFGARWFSVTWTHKPYLFQWGDVIINVWVVSEFSHEYVMFDNGIKFAKVMSVIRKKIAYQRNKDRAFLINLAYRFLGMVGANGKNLSAVFNQDYR
jgi:hypothetical protein